MDKNSINMLFLGDRLIADGVLRIYLDTYRSDNFSIAGVVQAGNSLTLTVMLLAEMSNLFLTRRGIRNR